MGTPVWNHDGIVCLANAHARVVKMTFPKGAKLSDPHNVFNAELAGNARRAIDWAEGDTIDVEGLKGLLRAAIALNAAKPAARKAGDASSVTAKVPKAKAGAPKKPAPEKPARKKPAPKKAAPAAVKKAPPKAAKRASIKA